MRTSAWHPQLPVAVIVGTLVAASAVGDAASWGAPRGSWTPTVEAFGLAAAVTAVTVAAALALRAALMHAGHPTAARALPLAVVLLPALQPLLGLSSLAQSGSLGAGDVLWVLSRPGWVAAAALLVAGQPPSTVRRADRAAAVLAAGGVVCVLLSAAQALGTVADPLGRPAPALTGGLLLTAGLVGGTAQPARRRWALVALAAVPVAVLAVSADLVTSVVARAWPAGPADTLLAAAVPLLVAAVAAGAGLAVLAVRSPARPETRLPTEVAAG